MAQVKLSCNIMLLGETGVGKSSTGNTLLNRPSFKTKLSMQSCTEMAEKDSKEINNLIFNVVDTPGVHDTEKNTSETLKNICEGISRIREGLNAFLFVLKVGEKSTKEFNATIEILKALFRDSKFKEFCIIAFTFGDAFTELNNDNIQQWCKNKDNIKVDSEFGKFLIECDYRVVLFYNNQPDKREESVNKLLSYIDLQAPRYTNEHLEKYADVRDAYMISLGFPEQRGSIQTKLGLLLSEIDNSLNGIEGSDKRVSLKLDDLWATIEIESKGTNLMDGLKDKVSALKSKIQNLPKDFSQERTEALEALKKEVNWMKVSGAASTTFGAITGAGVGATSICTATGVLCLIPGIGWIIGLGVVAVGLVSYGIYALSRNNEKDDKKKLL